MTTDWKALCAGLLDALDSGIPAGRIRMSPLAESARVALTEPQPEPPTDEEVAELVAWLGVVSEQFRLAELGDEADQTDRAATLLAQLQVTPVPVSERLPEPGKKVLAHYFNRLGNGRTVCAIWVPAHTRSNSYGDDDFTEYDEETDKSYWPEGWYEAIENWDDLGWVKVDEGEVVYWQPLPKWPTHALPLPGEDISGKD